jgi:hypothetical protein
MVQIIPFNHVELIRLNLLRGMTMPEASPIINLDRDTVAFILGGGVQSALAKR